MTSFERDFENVFLNGNQEEAPRPMEKYRAARESGLSPKEAMEKTGLGEIAESLYQSLCQSFCQPETK